MTRSDFLNCVNNWGELIELCHDYGCDICADIIDNEALDEYIDSEISDCDLDWYSLRDYLNGIETGYSYYLWNAPFDYIGLIDTDFDNYKSMVLDWMDNVGLWDDEEDEEDEEGEGFYLNDEPSDPPVEEEDFTVSDLVSMCSSELVTIQQAVQQRQKELDDNMLSLFAV